ncbi:MAG: glycosyl hydrolase 2 galactose-binding domain-containing protein, partial [Roseiflexaceae bacterium]
MTRQTRALSDAWHMRPVHRFAQGAYPRNDAPGWFATSIPSQWQSHPDLARYVGPMVYRTTFASAEQRTTRSFLRLNGVFYTCRPWLNGTDLGLHEGYFTPHTIDVSRLLAAQNELVLEVRCPDEHDKIGKRLITGVFSHWDSLDKTTNPGGVWLPVELIETGPVHLAQVLLATTRVGADHADVRYRIATDALAATDAVVTWRIAPKNFGGKLHQLESRISVAAGQHEASGMIRIPDPELWWSHDLGHPALYEITATIAIGGVASDSVTFDYGIRMFEFRNWIPYLNGKRFLMKGNNYPPTDTRLATVTQARCATDVQLARECHMNVLRVHAHVAHPALYAEADAQGVLLWQDFPLQWLYARSVLGPALKQV